jgi:hypothetical protein
VYQTFFNSYLLVNGQDENGLPPSSIVWRDHRAGLITGHDARALHPSHRKTIRGSLCKKASDNPAMALFGLGALQVHSKHRVLKTEKKSFRKMSKRAPHRDALFVSHQRRRPSRLMMSA